VGGGSCYLREGFYEASVCLDDETRKDVFVCVFKRADELVGMWSWERIPDTRSMYGRLIVIAPEHRGAKLASLVMPLAVTAGRAMGAEFLFGLATLKIPHMQNALEKAGFQLIGFTSGYDCEEVALATSGASSKVSIARCWCPRTNCCGRTRQTSRRAPAHCSTYCSRSPVLPPSRELAALGPGAGLVELPPGFGVQAMRRDHIDAAIAALRRWYPDITFGVNSCFLREDFYRERVCLDGAIDKDVIVLTLWHGDELVGVWSGEREVDSLALWGRLVVIAPEHARIGLTSRTIAAMEEAGRRMGAAFIYALVTLKHPHMQQGLERAGYRLLGFFPGYDRELVAPGVVKRVYQAVYAKLLAPENKVLRPDPKNMTPRTKRLYELLFPN
jgi:GNAT superfamily N-acetyltransferase